MSAVISERDVANELRVVRAELGRALATFRSRCETLEYAIAQARLLHSVWADGDVWERYSTAGAPPCAESPRGFDALSTRQREVLDGVLAGKPNKQIAYELGLSQKTVETHRSRLMSKLAARSFADLVRLAVRAGIV